MSSLLSRFYSRFINVSNTDELKTHLESMLPYSANDIKVLNIVGSVKKFHAVFDCKADDVEDFVKRYQELNHETLRKRSFNNLSDKNPYKNVVYYRCQHNTRYQPTMSPKELLVNKPNRRFKNTNCPFSLVYKLKKIDCDFPVTIDIEWNHNHPTKSLQSFSFKDIPSEVSAQVKELFEHGYTPALAYREYLIRNVKTLANDDLDYHVKISDRSKVPQRRDFSNMYTEWHKGKYGTKSIESMTTILKEKINQLNLASPDILIKFQEFNDVDNEPFILIIVTPLMKRVHEKVQSSSELVFLDSTGGMEEYNLRIFLMVTHSPVGALPLGIVVTSDETTDTIVQALEMFSSLLGEAAFFGKGLSGPEVFMTDNCLELHDAISAIWPKSTLMLCIFHLMQQVWRWLFDRKHSIASSDRPVIMKKFREVVYASDVVEMNEKFVDLIENEAHPYPNLVNYLEDIFEMKERWCLCFRKLYPMRGNNTNNYVESQFLVLKDNILNRTKEININGLLSKLTTDFNDHYKDKLLEVASGRFGGIYSARFKGEGKNYTASTTFVENIQAKLEHVTGGVYIMPSFSNPDKRYHIDMDAGFCDCAIGINGSPCKHQHFIWVFRQSRTQNFLPLLSPEDRKLYSYLAVGEVLSDEYYDGLHDSFINISCEARSERSFACGAPERDIEFQLVNSDSSTIASNNVSSQAVGFLGRKHIDVVTPEECIGEFEQVTTIIKSLLDKRKNDQNLIQGLSKFSERVKKFELQPSRLASAFHSFGVQHYSKRQSTSTSTLKKVKKGKIPVQPEAVKRRRLPCGSKRSDVKGMRKRNNPFEKREISKKRAHDFSQNIEENLPCPKKAGRSMCSKTKLKSRKVDSEVKQI